MAPEALGTELHRNSFAILGASTRDDRRRIVELAADCALHLDDQICQKARSELTNPRLRIAAEVGWLPGISPNKSAQLLENALHDPISLRHVQGLPSLARANLLSVALSHLGDQHPVTETAALINQFAVLVDNLSVSEIVRDINEDRLISGFPPVGDPDAVEAVLLQRKRDYRDAIRSALNRMFPRKLVLVMTAVVESATRRGAAHAPELIDNVVDNYEVEAKGFLEREAENVSVLIARVRAAAPSGHEVGPLLDTLEKVIRNWDMVAQPIQMSMRARGIMHRPSVDLAVEVRALSVDLCNKHNMLAEADRITHALQGIFAELPEFAEKIGEDSSAIADIIESRRREEVTAQQEAADLFYEAEIGFFFKDILRISADGIEWRGHHYPLGGITQVRWGGVRHSVNFVPTGTTYTIAFGDNTNQSVIETRREDVYEAFTGRLWKAVCVRLLVEMLQSLQNGRHLIFGDATIKDAGVTLTRHRFMRGSDQVQCTWDDVTVSSADGSFFISSKKEDQAYVSLSYIYQPNAHLLEHVIRMSFKKGHDNLSDLLRG